MSTERKQAMQQSFSYTLINSVIAMHLGHNTCIQGEENLKTTISFTDGSVSAANNHQESTACISQTHKPTHPIPQSSTLMMHMSPQWTFRFILVETVWIDSYLIHSQSLLAMKRQELTDEQKKEREELKLWMELISKLRKVNL